MNKLIVLLCVCVFVVVCVCVYNTVIEGFSNEQNTTGIRMYSNLSNMMSMRRTDSSYNRRLDTRRYLPVERNTEFRAIDTIVMNSIIAKSILEVSNQLEFDSPNNKWSIHSAALESENYDKTNSLYLSPNIRGEMDRDKGLVIENDKVISKSQVNANKIHVSDYICVDGECCSTRALLYVKNNGNKIM